MCSMPVHAPPFTNVLTSGPPTLRSGLLDLVHALRVAIALRLLGGVIAASFFAVGAPAALLIGYLCDKVNRRNLLFVVVILGARPEYGIIGLGFRAFQGWMPTA